MISFLLIALKKKRTENMAFCLLTILILIFSFEHFVFWAQYRHFTCYKYFQYVIGQFNKLRLLLILVSRQKQIHENIYCF